MRPRERKRNQNPVPRSAGKDGWERETRTTRGRCPHRRTRMLVVALTQVALLLAERERERRAGAVWLRVNSRRAGQVMSPAGPVLPSGSGERPAAASR